ncbi:hypothetical protein [Streptomyces abikoensis]|uniref:hypothetical protein n=1 Tax=Streptomyces abikoensis TaxID=97398 RepID=UPI0036BB3959
MTRLSVSEQLRAAGLLLLPGGVPPAPLPLKAAWLLAACGPGDGRKDAWVDGWVDEDVPGLEEEANKGWFALAVEQGLFGPEREFLVHVPFDGDSSGWVRVRLLDEWDIMGAGAASGLLGSGSGYPEFVMASLDGRVGMRGTTYQSGVSSIVVPEPWRAPTVYTYMNRLTERATQPDTLDEYDREQVQAWLEYVQHHMR